ncbi:MAG: DUF4294 domain-containing protein [Bacteroidales bacterium]|nr:DUF4294 domain-containing protein [Bacteroidales bacterium]
MKRFIVSVIGLMFSLLAVSQSTEVATAHSSKGIMVPCIVVDGDSLALVRLPKVHIYPQLKFATNEEYYRYKKLVRDVKKVYPYTLIVRKTFNDVQLVLDTMPNNKQKKKYLKELEDQLVDQYYKELVAMTVRQGEILTKLIDRELGRSSYEIIKEFRGGMSAMMWQGVAKMFGESLKTTYDHNSADDQMIERIVIQIEEGTI